MTAQHINAFEADTLIAELPSNVDIADVGNKAWISRHETIERLNVQSHLNVQSNCEEFVTSYFLVHDKMEALVRDLLVTEVWKTKVFLKVVKEAAKCHVRSYFILFHEATVINLLEILFYNKECVLATGDLLVDLADYCSRKVAYLNAWEWQEPEVSKTNANELLGKSDEQSLKESHKDLNYAIAINALSILRYMTDFASELPLAALTRILNTNETICALVGLIEQAPWLRKLPRTANDKTQLFARYESGNWKTIKEEDLPRLGKVEAQVWLALHNLLIEPECRRKYHYNARNKAMILRLKDYIEETTVDQLPILVNIQRHLEEMLIMDPTFDSQTKSGLLIEQLSDTYHDLLQKSNFKVIIEKFKESCNVDKKSQAELLSSFSKMYNFDNLEELLDDPICSKCGKPAGSRCSKCKSEWYCS